ncbi:hypothetical protein TNCV_580271 [Trichonephila clavipes]|nr:hypothetical protein TNCV_580271 [Trichonephila clavipes]
MLFPVVFSKKLEISDNMLTSYACDNLHPLTGLDLPPYTIITHSVKRRQSVRPVSAIQGLLVSDLVILIHGQVTRMTPELEPLSKLPHHANEHEDFEPRQI